MIRLFVTIALSSIMGNAFAQQKEEDLIPKGLHWLIGHWERTNNKPGRQGYEQWDSDFAGRGVTMNGHDTLFVEKLQIVNEGSQLYYVADVPENKNPVYFKFTFMDEHSFTCENMDHDFPKKIVYQVKENHLVVDVSGAGKSIEYLFVKK